LVFLATGDGKVRAYDAKDGKILWTGDLPAGSRGIPTMYEWGGREYLVISATWPMQKPGVMPARGFPGPAAVGTAAEKIDRAYVAFALPEEQGD
jgi:quinoprotein glucose dehydrogenase